MKTLKWHKRNTKYKRTVQMMNADLGDVYCTVQDDKFTEVQEIIEDMSHRGGHMVCVAMQILVLQLFLHQQIVESRKQTCR
jgi:hypothetical protein